MISQFWKYPLGSATRMPWCQIVSQKIAIISGIHSSGTKNQQSPAETGEQRLPKRRSVFGRDSQLLAEKQMLPKKGCRRKLVLMPPIGLFKQKMSEGKNVSLDRMPPTNSIRATGWVPAYKLKTTN